MVGIVDPAVMLGPELVIRRIRSRVPMLPEGVDKEITLPVRLELQKNVPLYGGDNIDDLLVQPFLILGGELNFLGEHILNNQG
jgi:hypothetical protein